ncbi:MAG TPA: ornithine--oxo-acid transaminase [Gammaproteobacteria bacterium]|nr:ornithine--oxo-acid transaminase [Gammaproteobacteria bacterium]
MARSKSTSPELIRLTERHVAPNYAPLPVVLCQAEGVWAYDVEGRRYLDCISAYSSLNQGHRHPKIIAALVEQAGRLTVASRAVHNDRLGPFLERLTTLAGMDAALPMNTGAEAVETAIKLARKWGYRLKGVPRDQARIVVCRDNFHGRTTTIVGFSTDPQYRSDFGPYGPGFDIIDFDDAAALEAAIRPETVAFLVEPIQAEAGIIVPCPGYLSAARRICREARVLFMLDEIQTGLGRTGRLFAFEHEHDAAPDVLILGKALGGGVYPVSAVLASRDLMDVFVPGDHGSTFGGNPLAAAVAEAALAVIADEALPERAEAMGRRLREGIESIGTRKLSAIRGHGLLLGLEVRSEHGTARDLALRLLERGVLAKDTHRQVLRLAPPLIIDEATVDWLIGELDAVLS